jgi:hypothetical protein
MKQPPTPKSPEAKPTPIPVTNNAMICAACISIDDYLL